MLAIIGRQGSVRLMLLCLPMIANIFFYYAFGDAVSFFYRTDIGSKANK